MGRLGVLTLALTALGACETPSGGARGSASGPLTADIMVTIYPLQALAQALAGEGMTTARLLPAGVSPHAYDPLPSAVRSASRARLLWAIDPEVDGWVTTLGHGNVLWLNSEPDSDPHAWLDPEAVRRALPRLESALCTEEPAQCDEIKERATRLELELTRLVETGRERLLGLRVVMSSTFLDAFAHRMGMVVENTVSPIEGVEPSAAGLQSSIEYARVTALVVGQSALPERAARLVAEASGARFVELDPIGSPETSADYSALIGHLIDELAGGR
jgi:zinc transport system substrate-binding protein